MANLIDKYRAAQRRLRDRFEPYTAKLCPGCPDPCCRKPSKVTDFDLVLAQACGCALPSGKASDQLVQAGVDILAGRYEDTPTEPCEYLGDRGCIFPRDLRPFECAQYICSFLKKEISPGDMREIRRLTHRLSDQHRAIIDATVRRAKSRRSR